jgi:hypothetical protein
MTSIPGIIGLLGMTKQNFNSESLVHLGISEYMEHRKWPWPALEHPSQQALRKPGSSVKQLNSPSLPGTCRFPGGKPSYQVWTVFWTTRLLPAIIPSLGNVDICRFTLHPCDMLDWLSPAT